MFNTVKQVFFHCQEGSLVDHRAYKPYTLLGHPALRLVLDPQAIIFLDNCLFMSSWVANGLLDSLLTLSKSNRIM